MTNIFTAKYFLDCAIRDLGHEAHHTIAIAKLADLKENGYLEPEYADDMAKIVYNAGLDAKYDQETEDEFYESLAEDYEDDGEMLDMGFNAYMGCYDFDC